MIGRSTGLSGPFTWLASMTGVDAAKDAALTLETTLGSSLSELPAAPPVWAITPPPTNSTARNIAAYWLRVAAGLARGDGYTVEAQALTAAAASASAWAIPGTVVAFVTWPMRTLTGVNSVGGQRAKILDDARELVTRYAYTSAYSGVIAARLAELASEPREENRRTTRIAVVIGVLSLVASGVGAYLVWRHRHRIYRTGKAVARDAYAAGTALLALRS